MACCRSKAFNSATLALRRLVTVVNDPADRRRRAVTLTSRGRDITDEALKVAAEITTATLSPLAHDEQLQLARLLKRIA